MIGIRSVLEYISKWAGWYVPFLFASTKDRLLAEVHMYRYQFSHSFDSKSVSHAVTMGFVPG